MDSNIHDVSRIEIGNIVKHDTFVTRHFRVFVKEGEGQDEVKVLELTLFGKTRKDLLLEINNPQKI